MTEQLAVPRRASRDKSPIQEKIDMFMKSSNKQTDPSKLGELEYGRPVVGSKTEARGLKAHAHVFKEILELCEIIHSDGDIKFRDDDGDEHIGILFGDLFRIYTVISDKCVGLLLRARKHHLVTFEGETLFQKRIHVMSTTILKMGQNSLVINIHLLPTVIRQRRDDNTPIFLTKSISEIREILFPTAKGEENTVPWHTGLKRDRLLQGVAKI